MTWDQAVELAKHLAWPITTLLLAALFRSEVVSIVRRIDGAKLPGGAEFTFGKAQIDKATAPPSHKPDGPSTRIDKSKVGNIYWLGFDLMWTGDVVLRNAPHQVIVRGLRTHP